MAVNAIAVVEDEVRELVRRRGLDPVADPSAVRRLVDEVIAEYEDRSLTGSLPQGDCRVDVAPGRFARPAPQRIVRRSYSLIPNHANGAPMAQKSSAGSSSSASEKIALSVKAAAMAHTTAPTNSINPPRQPTGESVPLPGS